jgi:signal transduction histidine kinase
LVPSVLGRWSRIAGRVQHAWTGTSLSEQFLLAAAVVVGLAMLILGNWASDRIQSSATRGAAEAGAIFLQAFLQPYVQDLPASGALPPEVEKRLHGVLAGNDTLKRFILLKIWRLDQTLVYSSINNIPSSEPAEVEIRIAASGGLARHFEKLDEAVNDVAPQDNIALLEVYAPLYRMGTNEIIAVGEFYQSATALIEEQERTRNMTWLIVAAVSFAMLGILYLIVERGSRTIHRQRTDLERQVEKATILAEQNGELRKVAERSRVDASEANETFLSRIGSDLHDGPIQILSVLMLSLQYGRDGSKDPEPGQPPDEPSGPKRQNSIQLAKQLYTDLRNISTGLVLPEVQTSNLREVFESAIARHESLTGSAVVFQARDLPKDAPTAVKICAYRVVQEALNNGYVHAGGIGQRVAVEATDTLLSIAVIDKGGQGVKRSRPSGQARLGLLGLQNRVQALRGTLEVKSLPDGGTLVSAAIPLDPIAE